MEIYKHYRNGTSAAHLPDSYQPGRNETILSIHIVVPEYDIHIFPDAITIKHKYLSLNHKYFRVGKWKYCTDALQTFTGSERNRLMEMYQLLNELVTERSINSESIDDWSVVKVLQSHDDDA
ncbi:hypothetical protein RJ495_000722 [Pluralibacter gergoviae]|nr:hypothetical protein [Pluralibacter gergoviae]